MVSEIVSEIESRMDNLVKVRRSIHAHPELGFQEHKTASLIVEQLAQLDIETHTGIGGTGVVGVIRGKCGKGARSVGLRADMDALPLLELTELPYKSSAPGRMHACGHDGHVVMLLAAAGYLQANRDFEGTVYLIFQPAEEGVGGGKAMVEDGLFDRFPVDAIYALHNWPSLPLGTVSVVKGPVMAAADRIHVTIRGVGGHGGMAPHRTVDPILVAGHVITAVNHIVSRNVDPLEHAVLSLCGIHAGSMEGFAVVPDSVEIVGTTRSLNSSVQALLERRLNDVVTAVASAWGARAEVRYERLFPMTINTSDETELAVEVASELLGSAQVRTNSKPSMAGEDFAYMLQERPGAYIHLGTGTGNGDVELHNPHFDFNDRAIPIGGALLAGLAQRSLLAGRA